MTDDELRRRRAQRQLLARPPGHGPAEIVRHLLAVQAQDPRAARLALRARGGGFTAADVGAAPAPGSPRADGPLVVAWLMRGTLHLVAREDRPWLLGLTAPSRFAASRRRLGQEGVSPDAADRAVSLVERSLADAGPLTRAQLGERLAAAGIRTEGQALPHLLMLAALRGGVVLVGDATFALAGEPAPPLEGESRDAALAELARRWLAAHGPASDADLAAWSGLPLRDARAGLQTIAGELRELDGGLVELAAAPADADDPPPRLLPAFDPYLLGWKDRAFAVAPEHARRVHPGGGIVRATATVDGRAVGTWSARRRGGRLDVELDLFTAVAPEAAAALEREAEDVARFAATASRTSGSAA